MKKLLLLLISTFISFSAFSEHLKFAGIEIDGSKTVFVKKLQQKGYKLVRYVKDGAIMTGKFAGKTATINIAENDNHKVFGIIVDYLPSTKWSDLMTTYDYYKNLYSEKYGEPTQSTEENKNSWTNSDDNKMRALCDGGCTWESWFTSYKGDILLNVKCQSDDPFNRKGNISIMYRDAENFNNRNQQYQDDI